MANLANSLAALSLLATHPRIDRSRIGVMGFSRGGQVALYSLLEPLRRGVVDDSLRFAAHIALYPSCSIPYHAGQVSPAPVLMLLGAADDYTPAAACRDYAAWFAGKGVPIQVIAYDGAHHDFDIPEAPRFLPHLQSARGCKAEVEVDSGTVRRPTPVRRCASRRRSLPTSAPACSVARQWAAFGRTRRAERDVAAFLRATLRPMR